MKRLILFLALVFSGSNLDSCCGRDKASQRLSFKLYQATFDCEGRFEIGDFDILIRKSDDFEAIRTKAFQEAQKKFPQYQDRVCFDVDPSTNWRVFTFYLPKEDWTHDGKPKLLVSNLKDATKDFAKFYNTGKRVLAVISAKTESDWE